MGVARRQHAPVAAAAERRHGRDMLTHRKKTYKVILEEVKAERKKLITLGSYEAKPPAGYTFIPAGDPVVTNKCKEFARKDGAQVFIVSTTKHRKAGMLSKEVHRMGYHFPNSIVERACTALGVSLNKSGRIVRHPTAYTASGNNRGGKRQHLMSTDSINPETSQASINSQATEAIKDLFPKIPAQDLQAIVRRAFEKGKERVGTAAELPLQRRVQLAVVAHIRHRYTDYDKLLTKGTWNAARQQVEKPSLDKLAEWRGDYDDEPHAMEDIIREVIVIPDDDEDEDSDDEKNSLTTSRYTDRQGSVEVVSTRNMNDVDVRPIHYGRRSDPAARIDSPDSDSVEDVQFLGHGQYVLKPNDRSNADRTWAGSYPQLAWRQALNRNRKEPTGPTYANNNRRDLVLVEAPPVTSHQITQSNSRQYLQETRLVPAHPSWTRDHIHTGEQFILLPKLHNGAQRDSIDFSPSQVSALNQKSILYTGPPYSVPMSTANDSSEPGQVQHQQPRFEISRPVERRPVDKLAFLPSHHLPDNHGYASSPRRVENGPICIEESPDKRSGNERNQIQTHDTDVASRYMEKVLPSIEDTPRYQEHRSSAPIQRRIDSKFAEVHYLDTQSQPLSRPTMEYGHPDNQNRLKRRYADETDLDANDKRIQPQYYSRQEVQGSRLDSSPQHHQQMVQLSPSKMQPIFIEKSSITGHSAVQSHARVQNGEPVYVYGNGEVVRKWPESPLHYQPALSSPKALYPITSSQRSISEAFPARISASNSVLNPHASPRLDDFSSSRLLIHELRPYEVEIVRRSEVGNMQRPHGRSSDILGREVHIAEGTAERTAAVRPSQRQYEQIQLVDPQVRPRQQLPLEKSFETLRPLRQDPLDNYQEAPMSSRTEAENIHSRHAISRPYAADARNFDRVVDQGRSDLELDRSVVYKRYDANQSQDRPTSSDERRLPTSHPLVIPQYPDYKSRTYEPVPSRQQQMIMDPRRGRHRMIDTFTGREVIVLE